MDSVSRQMDEDDDFLALSSGSEDEGDAKKDTGSRRLKRKPPVDVPPVEKEEELVREPMDLERENTMGFGAALFASSSSADDEDKKEELAHYLPVERTIDLWLKDAGLVTNDRRPGFPPIPLPQESVKACRFETALLQAEEVDEGDAEGVAETKRLRRTWDAYVAMREVYYGPGSAPGVVDMLTGSTSNFSNLAFLDIEAGVDEEEEPESKKKRKNRKERPRNDATSGQASIASYFNRPGTAGRPAGSSAMFEAEEVDDYDYDDGFVVRDGQPPEEEKKDPEKDPGEMTTEELTRFREKKRRKLTTQREKLQQEQEELKALQDSIMRRHQKVGDLEALIERCESLNTKGKQEED